MPKRDPKKALTVRPPSADYEVGYGRPPVQSRFKPGQSGNPLGRPKGSRKKPRIPALNEERLKAIILEEAYRSVSLTDANHQVSIPMAQAVVRSLAVNAAKGNQRAQRLFTELLTATERDNKRLHDEWLETAIEYKVSWDKELERRKRLGIEDAPAPLPHPDHVIVDMKTGGVRITGPMTKEEKPYWDMLRARYEDNEMAIGELEKILEDQPDDPLRRHVVDDLKRAKRIRSLFKGVL